MRQEIDASGSCQAEHLATRLDIVRQTGVLKTRQGMPAGQPQRWQALLDKVRRQATVQ